MKMTIFIIESCHRFHFFFFLVILFSFLFYIVGSDFRVFLLSFSFTRFCSDNLLKLFCVGRSGGHRRFDFFFFCSATEGVHMKNYRRLIKRHEKNIFFRGHWMMMFEKTVHRVQCERRNDHKKNDMNYLFLSTENRRRRAT